MNPNAYQLKAQPEEALDLNNDHPIRWITRRWDQRGNLTQSQWDSALPTIVTMLQELDSYYPSYEFPAPDFGAAFQALALSVDFADREQYRRNLKPGEVNHLAALRWAIRNLVYQNALEPRIRRIVGAGLTCLIEPKVEVGIAALTNANISVLGEGTAAADDSPRGHSPVGVAVLRLSREGARRILALCMKSYRLLDQLEHWDAPFFLNRGDTLFRITEARNLLACFAMIDMQVLPWEAKAVQHLDGVGLRINGVQFLARDTLSRTDLRTPWTGPQPPRRQDDYLTPAERCEACLKAFTTTLPYAVNNDDGVPSDVGFATVGGRELTLLGALMFNVAQTRKDGCPWQPVHKHYVLVWMTAGNEVAYPLAADISLAILKAAGWCSQTTRSYNTGIRLACEVYTRRTAERQEYDDPSAIPSIDEDDQPTDQT